MPQEPPPRRPGPLGCLLTAVAVAAVLAAAAFVVRPGLFRAAVAAVGRAADPAGARIRDDLERSVGDPTAEPVEWFGPVLLTADDRARASELVAGGAGGPDAARCGVLRKVAAADPDADVVAAAVRYRVRTEAGYAHALRLYLMSDESLWAVDGGEVSDAGLDLFGEMTGNTISQPGGR